MQMITPNQREVKTSQPTASQATTSQATASQPRRRGGPRLFRRPQWQYAMMFLAPAVFLAILTRIYPGLVAFWESLFKAPPGGVVEPYFVGLQNYFDAFARDSFQMMMLRTIIFNVLLNPLQVGLSLAIAMLLVTQLRGAGIWRSLIFLPVGIPHVVSAIVFGILLRPDGAINALLAVVGLPPQPFLTSEGQAIFVIMLIATWIGTGFWMVFLIAGLRDIPEAYYEAARIDGAGFFRTFFNVTLPLLRRPLLFVLVANTVANFVIFVIIQLLTNGGPNESTSLIMFDIYQRAFQMNDFRGAYVETVILLVIMLLFVGLQFKFLSRESDEQ